MCTPGYDLYIYVRLDKKFHHASPRINFIIKFEGNKAETRVFLIQKMKIIMILMMNRAAVQWFIGIDLMSQHGRNSGFLIAEDNDDINE